MNIKIAAAVASALFATTASAWDGLSPAPDYQLVVTGSSALKDAILNEFKITYCGNTTGDTVKWQSPTKFDFFAETCTTTAAMGTIPAGKHIVVYYRAQGGSINGLAPFVLPNSDGSMHQLNRLSLASTCTLSSTTRTCQVNTNFNNVTDTTPDPTDNLTTDWTDLGVFDVEAGAFTGENLPNISNSPWNTVDDATWANNLAQTTLSSGKIIAQGFNIVVQGAGATAGLINNTHGGLSSATLDAILRGTITDWSHAFYADGTGPISSTSAPILLCRRDAGSGTQTIASIAFNNFHCGKNPKAFALPNTYANNFGGPVVVNYSSDDVIRCVASSNNAIGILAANKASTTAAPYTVPVDGQQWSLAGLVSGAWKFGAISWYATDTADFTYPASHASAQQIASALLSSIKTGSNVSKYANNLAIPQNVGPAVTAFNSSSPVLQWDNSSDTCNPAQAGGF